MTTHFLSFLFDFFIWAAYGGWVGYWSAVVQKSPHMRRRTGLYSLGSVCLGLWSVLTVGLPETGFAVLNFIYVSILTFMAALLTSRRVQAVVEKEAKHIIVKLQQSTFMKGGVVHGHSH